MKRIEFSLVVSAVIDDDDTPSDYATRLARDIQDAYRQWGVKGCNVKVRDKMIVEEVE